MFPTATSKPTAAKSPPPTWDQALTLLIAMFERKLTDRRRDEAEKKAAAERAMMEKRAALDRQVAAARAEFEILDEQLRRLTIVLEQAGLAGDIEAHIQKRMPPHQLENFRRLRSQATATLH